MHAQRLCSTHVCWQLVQWDYEACPQCTGLTKVTDTTHCPTSTKHLWGCHVCSPTLSRALHAPAESCIQKRPRPLGAQGYVLTSGPPCCAVACVVRCHAHDHTRGANTP
eukprot:190899-Chlamydomonas_euryale.AAC.4